MFGIPDPHMRIRSLMFPFTLLVHSVVYIVPLELPKFS
jgi:hypothetical protein